MLVPGDDCRVCKTYEHYDKWMKLESPTKKEQILRIWETVGGSIAISPHSCRGLNKALNSAAANKLGQERRFNVSEERIP